MLSCRMHNYSHHFVFYKRKVSSEKGYFYRLGRAKISAGKDAGLRKPPSHLLCHSLLHKGIFSLTENSYLRQMRHSHHFCFSHVKQRLHCPQWISPPLDKKISLCRPWDRVRFVAWRFPCLIDEELIKHALFLGLQTSWWQYPHITFTHILNCSPEAKSSALIVES